MNKYYLINNKIMKGGEMPDKKYYKEPFKEYNYDYDFWINSIQQCKISDIELLKLNEHLYHTNNDKQGYKFKEWLKSNPINVTDIVEEKNKLIAAGTHNFINESFIYFKKPKKVESDPIDINKDGYVEPEKQVDEIKCQCLKCSPIEFPNLRFNVCPICGNKRCPHASDHEYKCTNSNDVGQLGSIYGKQVQSEPIEINKDGYVEPKKQVYSEIDYNVIALNILSNVEPKLTEKEEAFFIAGFRECIKYFHDKKCNAIDFADWISENYFVSSSGLYHHNNWSGDMDTLINYTTKELYEIFLKEKNIS